MTEREYTPGPWLVVDSWETNPHKAGTSDRAILILAADTGEPSICHVAEVGAENVAVQERELANARLIAASPDLLAALKLALPRMRHSPSCEATIDRGTWKCMCGMVPAYDAGQDAIRKTRPKPAQAQSQAKSEDGDEWRVHVARPLAEAEVEADYPDYFVVEYEQPVEETGLDGPSLTYAGPFHSQAAAEDHLAAGRVAGKVIIRRP